MSTFKELGIPFPLFKAQIQKASDFVGTNQCSICGKADKQCFSLGIGSALIIKCRKCEEINGLKLEGAKLLVCYECLRERKAAFTQDTEFGMVSWEQAAKGITHGVPDLEITGYETISDNEGWTNVRVEAEYLWELITTPTYNTWQGEQWQFCCQKPMVFQGEWQQLIQNQSSENWAELRSQIQALLEEVPSASFYIFKCNECNRFKFHYDFS